MERILQGIEEPLSADRFVFGRGKFVDDIHFEGMLHLKVIRSPYARARITRLEGGINGNELNAVLASVGEGEGGVGYPVLPRDFVNYVGQPVAAVFDTDRYKAEDRAEEVQIDYEPLKPIISIEDAIKSEPIHSQMKSNIVAEYELGKKFEQRAEIVLEDTLEMQRIIPNPLEPRGIIAFFDGTILNIFASTQSVHAWREGLSSSLKISRERIRVIQMDTGGAFGSKGGIYPEYIIASYLSLKTKRPVKWIETRLEHLQATNQGRGVKANMKIFANKSGRVSGLKAELYVDAGAYPFGAGIWSPRWIGYQITGPYAIRDVWVKGLSVLTNKVPQGPYRGAGRPEAAFFIERMMDRLADELGKDPFDIRLINTVNGEWRSRTGLVISDARRFLNEARKELLYDSMKRKRYIGFSFFVLIPAVEPGESARILIKDGRVRVWLGGSSHGQGHEFFARKVVSKELGIPIELIDFVRSDTEELGEGVGSWGSRSALLGGAALVEASRQILNEARKKLGKKPSAKELLRGEFDKKVFYKHKGQENSLGANLAIASFDEHGFARIEEIRAFYDAGVVLNEDMVISQIFGGSIQGLGEVISEIAAYNEDGQIINGSISEAGVLKCEGLPKIAVVFKRSRSSAPHGAKGVGESPTIGVPPACTRAIELLVGERLSMNPIPIEKLLMKKV